MEIVIDDVDVADAIEASKLKIEYIKNRLLDRQCFQIVARLNNGTGDLVLELDEEFKNKILEKCIRKNKEAIEAWTKALAPERVKL
jgi:hypothetical protein